MDFFKWVLSTSVMACLIVGLILLVKFILGNRLKPRWHYILWLLLTLRLILPWTPESPFSIFNLFKIPTNPDSKVISYDIVNQVTQTKVFSEVTSVQSQASESNPLIIFQIVFWVWVLGVIFFGVYTIMINRKFAYRLQRQTSISDPNILKVFENCKKDMFIRKAIRLMGSNQVTSPTLFGFLHPSIIISELTKETLTLEQFRYIFLHELAHYKRKDIAINWLMQVLLIIHWFNPILWYAFRRMREDQEIACDALALTQIHSNESKEYGQTIITLLESFSEQKQIPGMANLSDNKAQLKRRITMIQLYKKNSYRWSLLGVAVLIGLGGLFLTNGKTSAIVSAPQQVLEAYLDSAIKGDTDKAFSYVTARGINDSISREEFEAGFNTDKLLSYKINKFFNDDDTHASASITLKLLNEGELRITNDLIKRDEVWKITRDKVASPSDSPQIETLNVNDNRPSQAVVYEIEKNISEGKVGVAQPSIQPTQPTASGVATVGPQQ
jgi:bla regulator protein BlaR1